MDAKKRQYAPRQTKAAFTITELLVVIGIMVILITLVTPAFTKMFRSHRQAAASNLINSALTYAKAHAAATQQYAGLRFQFDRDGPLNGRQYIVLIEKAAITSQYEYRPVADRKPTPIPKGIGILSGELDSPSIVPNDYLDDSDENPYCLKGATTFTIIFSPTGQMVSRGVEVRGRDQYDAVLNTIAVVDDGDALLYDDGFRGSSIRPPVWCVEEPGTSGFYIFDQTIMADLEYSDTRYTDYISRYESDPTIRRVLINAYTGTIIEDEDVLGFQ